MSHLEDLIAEFYDWKGYLVKRNIKVGPKNREELCGARLQSVNEFAALVRAEIVKRGKISKSAIPEQYPILRTIQLLTNGYYRIVS